MDRRERFVTSIPSLVLFLLSVIVLVARLRESWYVFSAAAIIGFIWGLLMISGRLRFH